MKEGFYVVLLIFGLVAGWFVKGQLDSDATQKLHLTLEQATKQSKFSLVRDDFAEYFYLCEEKGLSINHWKALFLTGYSFQYGVDSKDISLKRTSSEGITPETWEITVNKIEVLSSELKTMKAFTLDKAWFKNATQRISDSKDELIKRKDYLAYNRIYGDPDRKIFNLLGQSILESIINISKALNKEVVIRKVNLPDRPSDWDATQGLAMTFQCGDITPVFKSEVRPESSESVKSIGLKAVTTWDIESELKSHEEPIDSPGVELSQEIEGIGSLEVIELPIK